MLISGLVSLNVHEPLTFEGTKIVLHPDIFSSHGHHGHHHPHHHHHHHHRHPSDAGGLTLSSSFSTAATGATAAAATTAAGGPPASAASRLTTVGSKDSAGSTATAATTNTTTAAARLPPSLVATGSSDNNDNINKLASIAENNSNRKQQAQQAQQAQHAAAPQPPQRPLSVGDMIEIQVWDPLPRSSLLLSSPEDRRHRRGGAGAGAGAGGKATTTTTTAPAKSPLNTGSKTTNNASSIMRPRTSIPPSGGASGSQPPVSAQSSSSGTGTSQQQPSTRDTLREAAATLGGGGGTSRNRSDSMQYSDSSHQTLSFNLTGDDAASHTAAGSNVAASAAPPIAEETTTTNTTTTTSNNDASTVSSADERTASVHNEEGAAASPSVTTMSSPQHSPSPSSNSAGGGEGGGGGSGSGTGTGTGTQSAPEAAEAAAFPAKTVTTSSTNELPPVFPRSRANTTEAGPPPIASNAAAATTTATTTLPPKPPSLSRARSAAASPAGGATAPLAGGEGTLHGPSAVGATTAASKGGSAARSIPPISTLPRPRHFRDLSDMTIDTVYDKATANTTTLDGSHQLVGLNVPVGGDGGRAGAGNTTTTASTGGGVAPDTSGTPTTNSDDDDYEEMEDENEAWAAQLSRTHSERLSLIMLVTEKSLTSLKSSARTQVSLLRPVAELYNLSSYDTVTVRKVERHEHAEALEASSADFVLVTIKDQFITRGDMHYFQNSLLGSWVYEGQRLSEGSRGIQAHARELRHKDRHACSGIITEQTKITFRSRSARLIWLVQMSSEMWDYSSPYKRGREESRCETYFDKWIGFLHRLFAQWKELEVTHSLTIVFFSRTFLGSSPPLLHVKQRGLSSSSSLNSSTAKKDVYGRSYEDHFRIVAENTTYADWDSLIVKLKEAFVGYPTEVGWNLSTGEDARRPSSASQGNVLEAINVTLNLLQFHYLDRDLHRTGNSIVLVSAGNGVFEVGKGLASITYERMMVNGIGSDMLSLALPPLHTAPFFLYVSDLHSVDTAGVDFGGTYYEVPHWMHLSFVSYDTDSAVAGEGTALNVQRKDTMYVVTDIDGRPVMANGFLMPGVFRDPAEGSTGTSPTFLSTKGGVAGSPAKKSSFLNQERQMIAGRDFNDILEACRPRNAGVLPSALEAVLRMSAKTADEKNHQAELVETKDPGDDIPPLPEWGSMAFDAEPNSPIRHRRIVALGEEPAVDLNLEPTPSGLRTEEGDKSSVSSSYTSQYSSCGLGVSYDRPFLASGASPTLTGIQVQKSPSMEIFFTDDEDEDGSDASVSSTGLDLGGESSVESSSEARRRKRGEKVIDSLRKLMRECDTKSVVPSSPHLTALSEPNLGQNSERSLQGPPSAVLSQQLRPQSRTGASSGGIGAALSQYRVTSGGSTSVAVADSSSSFARTSSSTLLSGMGQTRRFFPDVTSRGMSPLLLPPVGQLSSSDIRRSSFENRFINPSEIARSGVEMQGKFTQFTQRSSTVSAISRSPPTSGSPILTSSVIASLHGKSRNETDKQRGSGQRSRSMSRSRRKKAFNPFRQQDEDEVLAKKSHNRRRWSHVFPLGEVEFKRHAGPNWKSLAFPAILPLSIDYFPPQQEVDQYYTFSIYNVTLSEFENSPYSSFSSNKDVLMEMVRQRLIQDYQLVPESHVNASNFRRETLRDGLANRSRLDSGSETEKGSQLIRQFLSMGHRLQVLTYDPSMDIIEVTRYDAKLTRIRSEANTFRYNYMCFCEETQQYTQAIQSFTKYAEPYNWNKVDRIVCGGEDREMREGMRFKRLMFGIIPAERLESGTKEQEYIDKFLRLLEYLNKLSDKGESSEPLNIKIVSNGNKERNPTVGANSSPGISSRNSMVRFYVRLRKSKRDIVEWMEVVMDHTFDTSWSYRIMFNWLVASADRVEAQVQLLQRRCSQFGLNLVPFPEITVSRNVFLCPFKAPALFEIDKDKVPALDKILCDLDYVHDGVFYTDIKAVLECIENDELYDFGKRWSRPPAGRQFVHRSGTLFFRVLQDLNRRAIVVVLGNYLYTNKNSKLRTIAQKAFAQLMNSIDKLSQVVAVDSPGGANSILLLPQTSKPGATL